MNTNNKHIAPQKTVSREEIARYLDGKMTSKEEHILEKMALENPFLADALDGLEKADLSVVDSFNKNLLQDKTTLPKNKNSWTAWAAVASVTAITFGLFLFINKNKSNDIAFEQHPETTEAPEFKEKKRDVISENKPKTPTTHNWEPAEEIATHEVPVIPEIKSTIQKDQPVLEANEKEIAQLEPLPLRASEKSNDSTAGFAYAIAELDDLEMEEVEETEPASDYLAESFAYLPPRHSFHDISANLGAEPIVQESDIESKTKAQTKKRKSNIKEDGYFYNQQPGQELDTNFSELIDYKSETLKDKKTAFTFIQKQNWKEALAIYSRIELRGDVDNEVLFYRSVAHLYLNETERSITDLNYLLNDINQTDKDPIKWYLALAYLQTNEPSKATPLLKELAALPDSNYKQLALELLQ